MSRLGIMVPFLFLGCAHSPPAANQSPYAIYDGLLENEKFDDAREFRKKPGYGMLSAKRLEVAETCAPILKECEVADPSVHLARKCLAKMADPCDQHLPEKFRARRADIHNRMIEVTTGPTVPPKYKNMCEPKKWGYWVTGRRDSMRFPSLDRNTKNIKGEFATRSECEEQRLLQSKEFETAECELRYRGDDRSIDAYSIEVMSIADQRTTSFSLTFENQEKCTSASNSGMEYYDSGNNFLKIGAVGTTDTVRFIGKCQKKTVAICEKYCVDCLPTAEIL